MSPSPADAAGARALYDPTDPTAPIEVIRNGRPWFTVPAPGGFPPGDTPGLLIRGVGWLQLTARQQHPLEPVPAQ